MKLLLIFPNLCHFSQTIKQNALGDIANRIGICYNVSRQKDRTRIGNTKERTPGSTVNTFGGSSSFTEKSTVWASYRLFIRRRLTT